MAKRRKIYRVLAVATWCLAGIGLCILLGAAVKDRSVKSCRGYQIDINGAADANWFIDKKDILDIITSGGETGIRGRQLRRFDLKTLETKIERNVWIADAQLFFDNKGILQVNVKERQPVARVFSVNGSSYYIDSSGKLLPVSDKMVAKLPVFTGFPPVTNKILKKDKELARDVIKLSGFISANPFWMAQIAQVDIHGQREFDIVPVIGNHLIELGTAADYEKKFNRLLSFYKQVLAKAGMDKYSRIRLQFRDQVVGVKKEGFISKYDSLKFISNIQELILASRKLQARQLADDSMVVVAKTVTIDSIITENSEKPQINMPVDKTGKESVLNPVRKTASYENKKRLPKAVMKKE
jgi:cell division protein FtsQ